MARDLQTQHPSPTKPTDWDRPAETSKQQHQPTTGAPIRSGGWFAIGGGLLLGVDAVAHLFVGDTTTPAELLGMSHELWHLPGILGIVAALIGLIAIYLSQAPQAGNLGNVGFVFLFVGVTLGAAYSTIVHAIFLPALEGVQEGLFEEFIDAPPTTAQIVRGLTVQAVGLGLGAILFGAATIRARVLPRPGGWLIIVAALFAAANEAIDAAQLISRILFAAAFVFLGSALINHHHHDDDRQNTNNIGTRRTT